MSPILDQNTIEIISRSSNQTRRIGVRLGSLMELGDVICLVGDLGSGKTTLVQGIAAGWGSLDPVSSPTFMIVNIYRRTDGQKIYHLDAYRLKDSSEAWELDITTMIEDGSLVIEWADKIELALPEDGLWISLFWSSENQRNLLISAKGDRYLSLMRALRKEVYGVY
jgi:tRNA threonylcarbamoyladenosine biosynthesis protein TsaE